MKKLSKTARLKEARAINKRLRQEYESTLLEQERTKEDLKDGIKPKSSSKKQIKAEITTNDINKFNDKSFIEALKDSGVNTSSNNVFADMERMVNSSEAIRELVDIKNIRMKTKVTDEQHKYIVMLYGAYHSLKNRYGIDFIGLRNILDEFIEIAPSIDGKRSEQYVTAHQAVAQALVNAQQNQNALRQPSEMKQ